MLNRFGYMFRLMYRVVIRQKVEMCGLLGHYEAYIVNLTPTFRDLYVVTKRRGEITTTRCVIIQKKADLIYFVAEA